MFVIMILQRCGNEGKPLWFFIPAGINSITSHIPGLQNYDTEIFGHLVVYGFFVFTGLQTICIILNERAPIQVIYTIISTFTSFRPSIMSKLSSQTFMQPYNKCHT